MDIALFAGHLIEKTDKSFRIVAGVPGVLGPQLIRFLLIVAAHSQQGQIQDHTQTEKAVLQGVIGPNSNHTSGKNHGRYLCSLEEDVGDGGLFHQPGSMARCHMSNLMGNDACQLGFRLRFGNQAGIHEQEAAGHGECIDLVTVQYRQTQRNLQIGMVGNSLSQLADVSSQLLILQLGGHHPGRSHLANCFFACFDVLFLSLLQHSDADVLHIPKPALASLS